MNNIIAAKGITFIMTLMLSVTCLNINSNSGIKDFDGQKTMFVCTKLL